MIHLEILLPWLQPQNLLQNQIIIFLSFWQGLFWQLLFLHWLFWQNWSLFSYLLDLLGHLLRLQMLPNIQVFQLMQPLFYYLFRWVLLLLQTLLRLHCHLLQILCMQAWKQPIFYWLFLWVWVVLLLFFLAILHYFPLFIYLQL